MGITNITIEGSIEATKPSLGNLRHLLDRTKMWILGLDAYCVWEL